HQAVEQQRGIPLFVNLPGDAGNKLEERGVLPLKVIRESLGHPVAVERVPQLDERAGRAESFFTQGNGECREVLDPRLTHHRARQCPAQSLRAVARPDLEADLAEVTLPGDLIMV